MRSYPTQKFLLSIIAIILIGIFSLGTTKAQQAPEYEENTLFVKFKESSGVSAKKMPAVKGKFQVVSTGALKLPAKITANYEISPLSSSLSLFDNPTLDHTFQIYVDKDANTDMDQLIKDLESDPRIEYVEKVPVMRILSAKNAKAEDVYPNDPFYGKVGNLNMSWHLDLINAQEAWEIQKGDPKIKIAVVDNAVVGSHEDLQIPATNLYNAVTQTVGSANPPATANSEILCNSIYGKDCPSFEYSHGTHCAGAVGAINNNGVGIASVGGGVTLLGIGGPSSTNPMSILNSTGGITWAANRGARIISCSFGSTTHNNTAKQLIKTCYEKNIILVCAAGNNSNNELHYPAAYYPYAISVGSVNSDFGLSWFTTYGFWVDILSPGGSDVTSMGHKLQIFSSTFCVNQSLRLAGIKDFVGKKYDEMEGTSMATPVAAGAIGLMLSKDSSLNTDAVRLILQHTSTRNTRNENKVASWCGTINIEAALKYMDSATFNSPISNLTLSTSHDTVWGRWTPPIEYKSEIEGYNLYRDGAIIGAAIKDTFFVDTNLQSLRTYTYAVEIIYKDNSLATKVHSSIVTKKYNKLNIYIRPSAEAGTVNGEGRYESNSIVYISATPAPNYRFIRWADGAGKTISTNPEKQMILMDISKDIFAYFEKDSVSTENENLKQGFKLSPNPAKDVINVSYTQMPMQSIQICNIQGQIFFEQKTNTQEKTINVSNLPVGVYFLKVTTQEGEFTSKFIKQ